MSGDTLTLRVIRLWTLAGWRQVHSNAIQCILCSRMLRRYDLNGLTGSKSETFRNFINSSGHCTTIGRSVKKFLPLGLLVRLTRSVDGLSSPSVGFRPCLDAPARCKWLIKSLSSMDPWLTLPLFMIYAFAPSKFDMDTKVAMFEGELTHHMSDFQGVYDS